MDTAVAGAVGISEHLNNSVPNPFALSLSKGRPEPVEACPEPVEGDSTNGLGV